MPKRRFYLLILTALLMLMVISACSPSDEANGGDDSGAESGEALATATDFPLPVIPTWTPLPPAQPAGNDDAQSQAPTPLPEPTQIPVDVTAEPTDEGEGDDNGTTVTVGDNVGIYMAPQVGEPGENVIVTGVDFPAEAIVTLHWSPVSGPTGPVYWTVVTDENGQFEVGLVIPPTDTWPIPQPVEALAQVQLRAFTEELEERFYWANLTYTPRPDPVTSLILQFENPDHGFTINVPNLWRWKWDGDDITNVRFQSPDEVGTGFALVFTGDDPAAVIPTVMADEFPGEGYTEGLTSVGSYPGTEVTTDSGQVVQFIPANGYVYVISFKDINGNVAYNILETFTLIETE